MSQAKRDRLWRIAMRTGHVMGCHQLPERSFHTRHYQFPLCARCTGLVIGQTAGWVAFFMGLQPSLWLGAAFLLPMALDGGLQLTSVLPSTNLRRVVTGLVGGLGVAQLTALLVRLLLRLLGLPQLF